MTGTASPDMVGIGLDPGQLDEVFPFHFVVAEDDRVVQVGRSLRRLCPELAGELVGDLLRLRRPLQPVTYVKLAADAPTFVVVELTVREVFLRGQTLRTPRGILFLGTPWVSDIARLGTLGLSITDFALHDPLVDYLTSLQTKAIALAEAGAMAERLESSRQHLTELLRENQRVSSRLGALVSQIPWGVLVEDEEGRVVLANVQFCSIFGIPGGPADLLGLDCSALALGARELFADGDAFDRSRVAHLAARELRLGEVFELKDGRVLERDYVPVFDDAGYRGHLWQYRDVTTARRSSRELEEARRRAETANHAKDEFLAMMSHEMRTPLGVIVGLGELLRGDLPQRIRDDFLARLELNARSLMKLIEDTLDFSRLDAKEVRLDIAPFDPRLLVDEVLTSLASEAHGKGLELVSFVAADVPQRVLGAEHRCRQVLVNLANNAIKFTDHGEIRIRVDAHPTESPDHVELGWAVEDTGRGIPSDMLEAVFERFVRVERSGFARGLGTGLGLAICRRLADAMSGRIDLESAVGRGSTFTLRAPFPVVEGAPAPDPTLEGARVLVATTSASLAASVKAQLATLGAVAVDPSTIGADEVDGAFVDSRLDDATREALAARVGVRKTIALVAPGESAHGGAEPVARPVGRAALAAALRRVIAHTGPSRRVVKTYVGEHVGRRFSVLLAEDDLDSREVVTHLLRRLGHHVDSASDGSIALEKARAGLYDLLLTDLRMGGLSGFELIREVRALEAHGGRQRLPIVALSADALLARRAAALEAGADEFLSKPARASALQDVLERLADRRPVVLIVDDARDLRMLNRIFLEADGRRRVVEAGDAHGALEVLARRRVDCVLLDLELPDQHGLELLPKIREITRGEVPVIIVSGHDDAATRQRCLDAGCDAMLTKPVMRPDLVEAVDRVLPGA